MKGLWIEKEQLTLRNDLSIPVATADEALVRVRLAGICGTDLELIRGYFGFTGVPGHEFVGEIVSCPGQPEREGQRVVGEINAVCGKCARCRAGLSSHCPERTVLGISGRNGAFAEYLTLPFANLHTVPDLLADEVAVFTEPVAAALQITRQLHLHATDRVLVIGAGRLGQIIARVLVLHGTSVSVAARHARQKACLEAAGITRVLDSIDGVSDFDIVVEATGSRNGLEQAVRVVRPRGTIVVKGTFHGTFQIDPARLVVDEVTLVGSRCGPFAPALRLLEQGCLNPLPLLEAVRPIEEGPAAVAEAQRPGALKILLRI